MDNVPIDTTDPDTCPMELERDEEQSGGLQGPSRSDRGIGRKRSRSSDCAAGLLQETKEKHDVEEAQRRKRHKVRTEAAKAVKQDRTAEEDSQELRGLEEVLKDGWVNATDQQPTVRIAPQYVQSEPVRRVKLRDSHSRTQIANMFAEIIGWGTLRTLASRMNAHTLYDENGERAGRFKSDVSDLEVLNMIGVHCMRATSWGERPYRARNFFRDAKEANETLFGIGVSNYEALIGLVSQLSSEDVSAVQDSLSSALRDAFHQGGERVIDEWLDSFVHGSWYFVNERNAKEAMKRVKESAEEPHAVLEVDGAKLLVYIPRKPHKVGHLHYILGSKTRVEYVDKGSKNEKKSYLCVFAHDIVSYFSHPKIPPDAAFIQIAERNEGTDRKLTIGDDAFNTRATRKWMMEGDHLCLLSGVSNLTHVRKHSMNNLAFGEYRYLLGSNGLMMTVLNGVTRIDEDFGEKMEVRKMICNLSNYLYFGEQERCICSKTVSRDGAELLAKMSDGDLRSLCDKLGAERASTNKYLMVHQLTGWNLAVEEEEDCGFCKGVAMKRRFHDSVKVLQAARADRVDAMRTREWTAARLKSRIVELGMKPKSNESKENMIMRIAYYEEAHTDETAKVLQNFRAQLTFLKAHNHCETSDRYVGHFNPVDMLNRMLYKFRFPITQSEIGHIVWGMIKLCVVNAYNVYKFARGELELLDFIHLLGESLQHM